VRRRFPLIYPGTELIRIRIPRSKLIRFLSITSCILLRCGSFFGFDLSLGMMWRTASILRSCSFLGFDLGLSMNVSDDSRLTQTYMWPENNTRAISTSVWCADGFLLSTHEPYSSSSESQGPNSSGSWASRATFCLAAAASLALI